MRKSVDRRPGEPRVGRFWGAGATRTSAVVVALALGVALLGGFVTARAGTAPAAGTGQTLRVAIGIDPDTLDPLAQSTTLVAMMVNHVVETLVALTPDGRFEPLLATDWSVSPDSREYTFRLRRGVRFHDGTPLNAEAVKFSVERFLDPTLSKPLGGFVGPLERVEVVDEYTVKLVYRAPFAPAMMGIAAGFPTLGIISPKAYREMGREGFSRHPVGTGPFRMVEWVRGSRVVMERNPDYWGTPARPSRIEWLVVPEAGTRTAMVLAGDVDVAYQPPAADIPRLNRSPGTKALSVPSTRIMFVGLNTTRPPLNDKRVRQALNYAVDSVAIAERVLLGAGTPDKAPIPASFFGYAETGFYGYDPDRARRMLAEAGYPDGFELTFIHPTGRYILDARVAEAIQSYLARVGVRVKLQTMDWPTYIGSLQRPPEQVNHDMALLGWGPLPDAHHTLNSMFHSSQRPPASFNIAYYSNPEVDRLIDEAARQLDPERRKELYRRAQAIIWDDAPWIFLYTQNMILGVRDNLEGMVTYPWEMFSLVGAYRR